MILAQADRTIILQPGQKQLFLDDHIVEEISGLDRTMHRPRKHGPVLKADIPSDGASSLVELRAFRVV